MAQKKNTKIFADYDQRYQERYGFADDATSYTHLGKPGITRETIMEISKIKKEPKWMLEKRLIAYDIFLKKPLPKWGGDLSGIDFGKIYYYIRPSERTEKKWQDVPDYIRNTFDKLGIPEAEKKFLAGVGAQYESEMMYHSIQKDLQKLGVIFLSPDEALKQYPDLVKEYFGTVIPASDNKFAALNSAVWSGGSFIYIPKGVKVEMPLQTYFRINFASAGQFERTLIIADEGSEMHYIEGCSAPIHSTDSLHSAVVEIIVKKNAKVRYTTIQNWSRNVYNLVTKRAAVYEGGRMEWIDGNLGSKLTMKYPSVYLLGEGAHGEILSLGFAGKGRCQDNGAKAVHAAPRTTSLVRAKSIARDGGITSYRGLVKIEKGMKNCYAKVQCDALLADSKSVSNTYPTMDIREKDAKVEHEASVSKIGEEQLFYLKSRGLTEEAAMHLIVAGFLEPIVSGLPMEYAIELNRLVELEMEGAVG
ncbi:Fe-S cluster assembly protein SufB [Candidatus Microgenomates bacterium]|nr:Fe-S cluster assembly protein SufB [Candidatus Microgenomates bacterium]